MKAKTKAEVLGALKRWEVACKRTDAASEMAKKLFGANIDSPMLNALWMNFEDFTDEIARYVGDEAGWLHWYYGENDMGANGLEASASLGRATRKISSIEDLARLLMQGAKK